MVTVGTFKGKRMTRGFMKLVGAVAVIRALVIRMTRCFIAL